MKTARLKIAHMRLDELKPHPRNPRVHPVPGSPEWIALKKSLEHDYNDPLIWNQRNGFLVSGHLRTKVLMESGYESADVVVVDYDEPTHIARMIAANKPIGENDLPALKDLLLELDDSNFDMSLSGHTLPELETLMTACPPSAEDQDAEREASGESREVECPKCRARFIP